MHYPIIARAVLDPKCDLLVEVKPIGRQKLEAGGLLRQPIANQPEGWEQQKETNTSRSQAGALEACASGKDRAYKEEEGTCSLTTTWLSAHDRYMLYVWTS
jgi:hypothetical protein